VSELARGRAGLILFLGLGTFLMGSLVLYTLRQRPPLLPADRDHAIAREPSACLVCHGPTGNDPRDPNHPLNDQCFSCHERP
jgi:hypothetical protein